MKMKRILWVVLLPFIAVAQLMAKPATPQLTELRQPDGSVLQVRLHGDEYFHYITTPQGALVMQCADGYYRYARLDEAGRWEATDRVVAADEDVSGDASVQLVTEAAVSNRLQRAYTARRAARSVPADHEALPARRLSARSNAEAEEVRGIIIMAQFQDVQFSDAGTNAAINALMNEEGNDYLGAIGSARDYFIAQSYGKFRPTFDVVGPVTLDNNASYYGGNDAYGNDKRPEEVIIEACQKASEQNLCDMSDYDLDGDGVVDLVYVIYAGYAESSNAPEWTIWPHMWYVYRGAGRRVYVDGVMLDMYACSSELSGTSGTRLDGIGSFCHEYSHTLGLPDIYDTQNWVPNFGMDMWSIMDYGCYAEDGRIPVGYSAYERSFCGWLTPEELTEPASVVLPYIGDNERAYRIVSSNPDQYFTLETRLQKGWDVGLPAEGLMIVKVDYDAGVWESNTVNASSSRPRLQIVAADNDPSAYSLEGDLYPYGSNNSFTSTSRPAMKIYNTTITGKPVENIAYNAASGIVTFDFMGGAPTVSLDAPVATSAGDITGTGFTAYWSPVQGATSYTLHLQYGSEERLYEYITQTRYKFEGLQSGTYKYKVKAVNGTSESEYSNEVSVTLSSAAELLSAPQARAYAAAGVIVIESPAPCRAVIYDARGMLLADLDVDGVAHYAAREGLYIVNCNGKVTKVLVR